VPLGILMARNLLKTLFILTPLAMS
jgi:hypothetical protein